MIRFIMIGGFLGAGKTTAIARLARYYIDQGQKVGLVTNDQAYDLVDTHTLRRQGFQVGEVPGACFCCKFDDLISTASELTAEQTPDVIITEPVGSCTDLVATVIEPLRHLHAEEYEIAPYAVLLKPEHGQKILDQTERRGFSPKAEYIFLKQIEEADIVVVNKIDKLSSHDTERLLQLVENRFPDKKLLAASGKSGDGFDRLVASIEDFVAEKKQMMEVDYDIYAEGEAELGWLNCTAKVALKNSDSRPVPLDKLVLRLVQELASALVEAEAEAAHLKILGMHDNDTAVANLVDSEGPAELSLASEIEIREANLIVNARVATEPELLSQLVTDRILACCEQFGLTSQIEQMQCFRPGRPVPTHRFQTDS